MKKTLFLILTSILSASNYDQAILILDGKKDVIKKDIIVKNCPYERCDDGRKGFAKKTIIKTDKGKAFHLLLQEMNNGDKKELAALKILSLLSKSLNYKSQNPSDFLLKILKKDYDIGKDGYKKIIKKAINILKDKNYCSGYYWEREFSKGFVGGVYKKPKNCEVLKTEFYKNML